MMQRKVGDKHIIMGLNEEQGETCEKDYKYMHSCYHRVVVNKVSKPMYVSLILEMQWFNMIDVIPKKSRYVSYIIINFEKELSSCIKIRGVL